MSFLSYHSYLSLTGLNSSGATTSPALAGGEESPLAPGNGRDVVVAVGRGGAEARLLAGAQPLDHGRHGDGLVLGRQQLVDAVPKGRHAGGHGSGGHVAFVVLLRLLIVIEGIDSDGELRDFLVGLEGQGSDDGRLVRAACRRRGVKRRLELEHRGVGLGARRLANLDDVQLEGQLGGVAAVILLLEALSVKVHSNVVRRRARRARLGDLVKGANLLRAPVGPAVHALDVAEGAGADADPLVGAVELAALQPAAAAGQHEAAQLVDGVLDAGLALGLLPGGGAGAAAQEGGAGVRGQGRLEGVQAVEAEQGQALGGEEDLVLAQAAADQVAVETARRGRRGRGQEARARLELALGLDDGAAQVVLLPGREGGGVDEADAKGVGTTGRGRRRGGRRRRGGCAGCYRVGSGWCAGSRGR